MSKLVTIGIPIYRRLEYLPNVLDVVARQDYSDIELLVSDNGLNGNAVPDILKRRYPRPFKFRQNSSIAEMFAHFNQILGAASGEYFVLLQDDDEISSNYVSELVSLLERNPQASAAIALHETMDEGGKTVRSSETVVPELLSGAEFIRAVWGTYEYGYEAFPTFMARTKESLNCGGYASFWKGTGIDDALLIKLTLNNFVAVSTRCAFRWRCYDSSHGFALSIQDLARGLRDYLSFLESDSTIIEYARMYPTEWNDLKRHLVAMVWQTYFYRWTDMYKKRLTTAQWIRAGFAMPLIPEYYRAVASAFKQSFLSVPLKKHLPRTYNFCRATKERWRGATQ
jgi:glycosyltransferase involved in cell wall biosynthesis